MYLQAVRKQGVHSISFDGSKTKKI